MKRLAFAILALVLSAPCRAHEDTMIPIKPDGTLIGLPGKYSPASLQVQFAKPGSGNPVSSVRLQLGKKIVLLPGCLTDLFETRKHADLRAAASWYHSRSTLPPYLLVKFLDPGPGPRHWASSGYSLLFDLDSGKLLRLELQRGRAGGLAQQNLPLDLEAQCSASERSALGR